MCKSKILKKSLMYLWFTVWSHEHLKGLQIFRSCWSWVLICFFCFFLNNLQLVFKIHYRQLTYVQLEVLIPSLYTNVFQTQLFLSAFKVKLLLPLNAKNYYTKSADIGHMCHADVSKPLNLALSDTYLLYFHLTHWLIDANNTRKV